MCLSFRFLTLCECLLVCIVFRYRSLMEYGFLGMRFDLICDILEFEFTSYREKHSCHFTPPHPPLPYSLPTLPTPLSPLGGLCEKITLPYSNWSWQTQGLN